MIRSAMISHVSVHDLGEMSSDIHKANSRAIKGSRLYAVGRLMVPLHAKTVNILWAHDTSVLEDL